MYTLIIAACSALEANGCVTLMRPEPFAKYEDCAALMTEILNSKELEASLQLRLGSDADIRVNGICMTQEEIERADIIESTEGLKRVSD